MYEKEVLYKVENKIAYLTINREAKKNSITPEVTNLFHKYLDEAKENENVRVISITGAGEKAFCSGANLSGKISDASIDSFKNYADLIKKLAGYPKPTVARVNGYCLAGGTGFMLACDIVIASDSAKFGTPEVNVGLFPMMIGAVIFKNVLKKKAMEMCLLGEMLTADQALEMGMLTRVVKPEKLDEEVEKVLKSLASKSPIGMKIGKEAFHKMSDMPFEEAVDYLSEKLKIVAATKDAKEGISAFIEKRKPKFTGE